MMLLNGEALTKHLTDRVAQLEAFYQKEEDNEIRLRVHGAIRSTNKLLTELAQFEVRPEQTPMDKIKAEPKQLVRSHARGTSWEAALGQTSEKRQRMYRAIYMILTLRGPLTDHELRQEMAAKDFPHSWSGVSARRVELERAGWVRDTGEKRLTEFGKKATVWSAVPEE